MAATQDDTHLYRRNASSMTPRAMMIWFLTELSTSSSVGVSRKVSTFALSSRHTASSSLGDAAAADDTAPLVRGGAEPFCGPAMTSIT